MKLYNPKYWNINEIVEKNEASLINSTNNVLERLNRDLNDSFTHAHLTMTEFITVIKQKSNINNNRLT